MALPRSHADLWWTCALVLIVLPSFCHAFGAGNIASTARIEGQNWRHGDIEDTLLTLLMSRAAGGKKFSKMDVKRVYFGNWLRDYSQAVDVGTVKSVSAEAIRIILWILGFMSFGYGTREFEVTTERLGCYQPTEHIDNPKDYADNLDARRYDRRLRGPVDERRELAIDQRTGLKTYIASEDWGINTSAGLVRSLFGRSIQLGRQYARSGRKEDLHEALRLLGTGCHCLEDYSAHSNYTELALMELGERDIFPHVGRRTAVQVQGAQHPIFPIVTGTFGGTDFLHSVMGEFSDKATQSELQELEGTISSSEGQGNPSIIKDLLDKLPSGLFGGKNESGKVDELQANSAAAKMNNMQITPKQPEAWTRQLQDISEQIYPILEYHDEIMQSITETIEKIPVLPDLIEQIQNQISTFVFSLLAPFVLPVIRQVKTELATGSSEIIQSSKAQQLHVFKDDSDSNPTHSMLSKDHFSNLLNEPAGKVASSVLKWVVPQLIAAWDDERIDVNRTLTRVINGVFHHPALRRYGDDGAVDGRQAMFSVVEQWWGHKDERERQELRYKLSREGVQNGQNHKEGVQDRGHGSCKPLGMPTTRTATSSGAIGGISASSVLSSVTQTSNSYGSSGGGGSGVGKLAGEAVGGGVLGAAVGGVVGAAGSGLLGGVFGDSEKKTYERESYSEQDSSYITSYTETGHHRPQRHGDEERYGQAQFSETTYASGAEAQSYSRYEQDASYGGGYGVQERVETRPQYGGNIEYERTTEKIYDRPSGGRETYKSSSTYVKESDSDDSDSDSGSDWEKKQRKREKKESKRREKEERERVEWYGGGTDTYGSSGYSGGGYEESSGGYEQSSYSSTTRYDGGLETVTKTYEERDSYGHGRREEYSSSGYGGEGYERRDEGESESCFGASGGGGGSYGYGGGRGDDRYESRTTYERDDEYGSSGRQQGYGAGYRGGGASGGYGGEGYSGRSDEYEERSDDRYQSSYGERNNEYEERSESYEQNESYGGGYGGGY